LTRRKGSVSAVEAIVIEWGKKMKERQQIGSRVDHGLEP
jgi:hypothetical protein